MNIRERLSSYLTQSIVAAAIASSALLTACASDADVASHNLSQAADRFEISRRIVFYNGITDTYMLTIEGRCSIFEDRSASGDHNQLEVTCKLGPEQFKKHFLGLSDNVTYFAEQLETADVSVYHHRIVFKPQSIIPAVEVQVDTSEARDAAPKVEVNNP